MNQIIKKFDLPCDMKHVIHSYCYNENGYNYEELNTIENIKKQKKSRFRMKRLCAELWEWKRLGVSVCWLRGGGVYPSRISLYGGPVQYELKCLKNAKKLGLI